MLSQATLARRRNDSFYSSRGWGPGNGPETAVTGYPLNPGNFKELLEVRVIERERGLVVDLRRFNARRRVPRDPVRHLAETEKGPERFERRPLRPRREGPSRAQNESK